MKKKAHVDWCKNLTIYEVNVRQFTPGGTFKEFEAHLPRLKALGVGILWFMPIQPIGRLNRKGTLGSYYSISDYDAINPEFGTLDEFKALVRKIHDMGMYVILDWVANHTAWDHVWTKTHPHYYTLDAKGNFMPPVPEWADVIDLNFDNPELRQDMIDNMKYWLTTADIDGFRCDMAHLVPTDFWNEARRQLDQVKPVFMLAETEDRNLLEHAFDSLYSWRIFHTINSIAKGERSAGDLSGMLEHEIYNFNENCTQLMFTSNHDENSWHGSAIERLGYALEPLNILTFTLTGIPLIYSGQEAGQNRRLDFFGKDLITWKEDKMAGLYRRLTMLRKENPALWSDSCCAVPIKIPTGNDWHIFAFVREREGHRVVVVLNLSGWHQQILLRGHHFSGRYREVFSDEIAELADKSSLSLGPWQYRVYTY